MLLEDQDTPTHDETFTRSLAQYNRKRLNPGLPGEGGPLALRAECTWREREWCWVERERKALAAQLGSVPHTEAGIVEWFERLLATGPGQNDPLFEYLANEATYDEMRYFIRQEVAGEAGFDDLVAMAQVKCPAVEAKLEMGNNFWDELGRGNEAAMHGPLLSALARDLEVEGTPLADIVPESLRLSNLLVTFALHRPYAYLAIGALGAIELTAPARAEKVAMGLKRLGLSPASVRYYALHSTLDKKHWRDWRDKVLRPLVRQNPAVARPLAEGAYLRLEAGARCFERYRYDLGLGSVDRDRVESDASA